MRSSRTWVNADDAHPLRHRQRGAPARGRAVSGETPKQSLGLARRRSGHHHDLQPQAAGDREHLVELRAGLGAVLERLKRDHAQLLK